MLQVNKSLTHLDLSYNQFEIESASFKDSNTIATCLLYLNLCESGITDDDADEYISHAGTENLLALFDH